jgi:hypothetical protein
METDLIEIPEAEDDINNKSSEAIIWFILDSKLRWFSLLSSIIEDILLQLLHIHYDFMDSIGKK